MFQHERNATGPTEKTQQSYERHECKHTRTSAQCSPNGRHFWIISKNCVSIDVLPAVVTHVYPPLLWIPPLLPRRVRPRAQNPQRPQAHAHTVTRQMTILPQGGAWWLRKSIPPRTIKKLYTFNLYIKSIGISFHTNGNPPLKSLYNHHKKKQKNT